MPYVLSMKVGLPPDEFMSLKNDVPAELVLSGRTTTLKKASEGFRLVTRGFDTVDEAVAFASSLAAAVRIWAAEQWAMATVTADVTEPHLFDEPMAIPDEPPEGNVLADLLVAVAKSKGWDHVDGVFNEPETVVYEESLNVLVAGVSASLSKGHGVPSFVLCVQEALDKGVAAALLVDRKMSLVIDLAIAAHRERSPRAKLFGLVSALEAMVDDEKKPEHVQKAIDVAVEAVKSLEGKNPEEASDLAQLANDLGVLRYKSTASRITRLLEEGLPEEAEHGPRDLVIKEILEAQGKTRSKLIHGHTDPAALDLGRTNPILAWATVRLIRYRVGLQGAPPVSV